MDVAGLTRTASRLDQLADQVRARAGQIAVQAAAVHWHSPAARGFFTHLTDVSATLAGCADRLQRLAGAVRAVAAADEARPR